MDNDELYDLVQKRDAEYLRWFGEVNAGIAALTQRVTDLETTHEALTASVGVVRADVTALQAQEPVRVLLARLEALSDERNAARRSQMEVAAERNAARRSQMEVAAERDAARAAVTQAHNHATLFHHDLMVAVQDRADLRAQIVQTEAERDALRRERDAARECVARVADERAAWAELETLATPRVLDAIQEATLYRAVVTRVRAGDLVRCATCEGRGHCADCEDERGEPRYGVPGLVPPSANAPLSVDVDLTPEETKP